MRDIGSAIVTGPTGAVGTALCECLLEKGIKTYAVVRPNSARLGVLVKGVHPVTCDLAGIEGLPALMHGCRADAFFHLAWADTVGAGRDDVDSQLGNVQHAVQAVRAAHSLGCKVFVGAGSQAEYGRFEGRLKPDTPVFPESGYGMAKLCAGQMTRLECRKLGMDHVWTRILSVYGPRDGMGSMINGTILKLLNGKIPALTAGEQKWDYLYCADAAEALLLCAQCGRNGAVYPVGSGVARPLKEYVNAIRDAIDPRLALGYGEIPYAPMQVMHLEADISALREDTGFTPKTVFDEGIRSTIEWVRSTL